MLTCYIDNTHKTIPAMPIKITCQLTDYSDPSKPTMKVHNHWSNPDLVELQVDDERFVVSASEIIAAVRNCTRLGDR